MCVLRKQYTLVGKETQDSFSIEPIRGDVKHSLETTETQNQKKSKNNNKKTLFF